VAEDDDPEASPVDGQDQEEHTEDRSVDMPTTNGESRVLPLPSNSVPASPTASTSPPSTTSTHSRTANSDITSHSPTSDINLLGSIDSWFAPHSTYSCSLPHRPFTQVFHLDTLRNRSSSNTSGGALPPPTYPKDPTSAPRPHLAPAPLMRQAPAEQHGHRNSRNVAPLDCQG
jgi:hypothetical protein